jgi:hypothetical protein
MMEPVEVDSSDDEIFSWSSCCICQTWMTSS